MSITARYRQPAFQMSHWRCLMSYMVARIAVAACLICWSGIVAAQVSGEFHLEKPVYAMGEPIFVYFQVVNNGLKAERLYSADPNSDCSAFRIAVSNDAPGPSCARAISCLSSSIVLAPGEKHVDHILLNLAHKIDLPGEYSVNAEVRSRYLRGSNIMWEPTTLHFKVDQNAAQREVFQPLRDQLRSGDLLKRIEAARALASVAPSFLEGTLLAFADDPYIKKFAPVALHRLNTPKSMAALAQLRDKTEPGTFEHWQAATYLDHDECADAPWSN
jgi:hypothetical protein